MEAVETNLLEAAQRHGVGRARQARPTDAVLGLVPSIVVDARSLEDVSRTLAWANEQNLKVVPTGTGTKQDRGAPPSHLDILLDLSGISGVVGHAAGDMTVVVRAGTRLDELQAELATRGQWLAIDPPVPGTVGGAIATGDSGPRRLRYGGVRDMLLGVTFVRADGTIARAGSKVVKNVAGYDLPKLFTGSLGTLGVLVEATFRLYPLPLASITVISKDISIEEASQAAAQTLASGLVPTVADYFAEGEAGVLAVRFETSPRAAHGQAMRARSLLSTAEMLEGEAERTLWAVFDGTAQTSDEDALARLVTTQSDLQHLVRQAQQRASASGVALSVRAHLGHGHALLRFHRPEHSTAIELLHALREEAECHQSSLVLWRAPREVREAIDIWGDAGEGLQLMRRVKMQFDPRNILNPGRFVGGI